MRAVMHLSRQRQSTFSLRSHAERKAQPLEVPTAALTRRDAQAPLTTAPPSRQRAHTDLFSLERKNDKGDSDSARKRKRDAEMAAGSKSLPETNETAPSSPQDTTPSSPQEPAPSSPHTPKRPRQLSDPLWGWDEDKHHARVLACHSLPELQEYYDQLKNKSASFAEPRMQFKFAFEVQMKMVAKGRETCPNAPNSPSRVKPTRFSVTDAFVQQRKQAAASCILSSIKSAATTSTAPVTSTTVSSSSSTLTCAAASSSVLAFSSVTSTTSSTTGLFTSSSSSISCTLPRTSCTLSSSSIPISTTATTIQLPAPTAVTDSPSGLMTPSKSVDKSALLSPCSLSPLSPCCYPASSRTSSSPPPCYSLLYPSSSASPATSTSSAGSITSSTSSSAQPPSCAAASSLGTLPANRPAVPKRAPPPRPEMPLRQPPNIPAKKRLSAANVALPSTQSVPNNAQPNNAQPNNAQPNNALLTESAKCAAPDLKTQPNEQPSKAHATRVATLPLSPSNYKAKNIASSAYRFAGKENDGKRQSTQKAQAP